MKWTILLICSTGRFWYVFVNLFVSGVVKQDVFVHLFVWGVQVFLLICSLLSVQTGRNYVFLLIRYGGYFYSYVHVIYYIPS